MSKTRFLLTGVVLSLAPILAISALEAPQARSRFSYSVSGAVNGSDTGKLVGIFGVPTRLAPEDNLRSHEGTCYIHFVLDANLSGGLEQGSNTDINLAFQAALPDPLRPGVYPIGVHTIVPNRVYVDPDPWAGPLAQMGAVFARLSSGLSADKDQQPDNWLSQAGVFRINEVRGTQVEASFEIAFIEEAQEFLTQENQRLPRRTATVTGEFTHPLHVGGPGASSYLDRWLCSQSAGIILSDYPDSSPPPETEYDEQRGCELAQDRLEDMRIAEAEYQRMDLVSQAVRNRMPAASLHTASLNGVRVDTASYQKLVTEQICVRYNEIRTDEDRELKNCTVIKADESAAMYTVAATGKIVTKRSRPSDPAGRAIWDAEETHEKVHQRRRAEHGNEDGELDPDEWAELMESAPLKLQEDELAAYPAGINFLEDWLAKNCRDA